jgi:hypothetical protein
MRKNQEEIGPVQITLPLGVIKVGPLSQSSTTSLYTISDEIWSVAKKRKNI